MIISEGREQQRLLLTSFDPPSDNRCFIIKETLFNLNNRDRTSLTFPLLAKEKGKVKNGVVCYKVSSSLNGNMVNWENLIVTGREEIKPLVLL